MGRSKNSLLVDMLILYVIFPWMFMLCPGDTGTTEHRWRHCKREAETHTQQIATVWHSHKLNK